MKTSDFYYDLPEELIAQDPLEDRSSSRLMTVDKETGKIGHHVFSEIIDYLNEGDCLVINDTKVICQIDRSKRRNRSEDRSASSEKRSG